MDQTVIERYTSLNWHLLLREDIGLSGSLSIAKNNLDRIKKIFDKIISYSDELSTLPDLDTQAQQSIDDFLIFCNQNILGDSYTDITQRDEKIKIIRTQEKRILDNLSNILSYFNLIYDRVIPKAELEKMEKKQIGLEKKISEGESRLSQLVINEEVIPFGREFFDLATENKKAAKENQKYMFLSLAITIILVFIIPVISKSGNEDSSANILTLLLNHNILFLVFIASIGGYIVAHFSRNYSAEMNMHYQNKHRQLSLNSHKRIFESIEKTENTDNDKEIRNAILIQVTKAMYQSLDSGYLKKTSSPVPTNQIVENIKLR